MVALFRILLENNLPLLCCVFCGCEEGENESEQKTQSENPLASPISSLSNHDEYFIMWSSRAWECYLLAQLSPLSLLAPKHSPTPRYNQDRGDNKDEYSHSISRSIIEHHCQALVRLNKWTGWVKICSKPWENHSKSIKRGEIMRKDCIICFWLVAL